MSASLRVEKLFRLDYTIGKSDLRQAHLRRTGPKYPAQINYFLHRTNATCDADTGVSKGWIAAVMCFAFPQHTTQITTSNRVRRTGAMCDANRVICLATGVRHLHHFLINMQYK